MTNQKKEDKPNTTLDKIKKYGPIVATSAAALALAAVTGGVGLLIAGVVVAGVVYVQSADALKEELEKSAGPKINRPLQFKEDIKENEQSLNGRDFFKVPKDTKLDNKSYLMLGKGESANLYYIDSEGNARKMGLKNAEQFKQDVQSQQQLLNNPNKIRPNEHLNQFIQKHVETDKLQTTRQTTKKVVAGIGLAIAIAGVMAALPFVGIPVVGALAICGVGLGIALAAPFVGGMLKKFFNRGGEIKKETSPSSIPIQQRRNEDAKSKDLETSKLTTLDAERAGVTKSSEKEKTMTETQDSVVLMANALESKIPPPMNQSAVMNDEQKKVIEEYIEEPTKGNLHSFDNLSNTPKSPLSDEIKKERSCEQLMNNKLIEIGNKEESEGEGRKAPPHIPQQNHE